MIQIGMLPFAGVAEMVQQITAIGMQAVDLFLSDPSTLDGFVLLDHTNRLDPLHAANKAGKPILGLGRGAQCLVEAGLVPGLEDDMVGMHLIEGSSINHQTHIKLTDLYQRNVFTTYLKPNEAISVCTDTSYQFAIPPALLQEIENQGLNVFQYDDGTIAAVSNKAGNVLALIAQLNCTQPAHPILLGMRDYIDGIQQHKIKPTKMHPLFYYPRFTT